MRQRFVPFLLLAAGLLMALFLFSRATPATSMKKEKAALQAARPVSSSAVNPVSSQPSSPQNPSSAPQHQFSGSSKPPVNPPPSGQNSTSLAEMEPWADIPSSHMKSFGEPARARATVKGKSFPLIPNQLGIFQRVYVGSQAQIAVEVEYPQARGAEPVVVQVQDGGQLDNGKLVQQEEIRDGRVAFHFQVTQNPGIHRVSLRKGSDVKTLDFWVGPPLPVRTD